MKNKMEYNILRKNILLMAILLSLPVYAQIQVSGDIQVSEISPAEYENALKNRLQQPKYHKTGKKIPKLMKAYMREFMDSLMLYYRVDSLNENLGYEVLGYEELHLQRNTEKLFLTTVTFPIQDYSYLYNRKYERVSNAMWGGGVVDGSLYVAAKGFDCDEYVHLRFYNLSQPDNYCAEIKEESFNYFIPSFDNRESYVSSFFFDKSHHFFFTIMKKWDGPHKYYKVTFPSFTPRR